MKRNDCLNTNASQALILNLLNLILHFPTLKLGVQLLSLIHITDNLGAQALYKAQTLGGRQRARHRPCCQQLKTG